MERNESRANPLRSRTHFYTRAFMSITMTVRGKTILILGLLALILTLPLICDAEIFTGPTSALGTVSYKTFFKLRT